MQWIKSRNCDIIDNKLITDFSKFKVIQTSQMAKNHEINVCFLTNAILPLCHAPPKLRNSKSAGFQTKAAIELESCKQI